MSIVSELSSQVGDKTEKSSESVSEKCMRNPKLLKEIVEVLSSENEKLIADAVEVLTFVSKNHPDLVAPYSNKIVFLLGHKNTKVRWEATHTIAQIAATNPGIVKPLLESLHQMALSDKSKIVQDYSTIAIGNYGGSGRLAANEALPILTRILEVEGDRQAVRVLEGMSKLLAVDETLRASIRAAVRSQADSTKSSIKQAYTKLIKQLG